MVRRSVWLNSLFAASCVAIALLTDGCLADKRTLSIGGGDGGTGDETGPRPNPEEDAGPEPGETLPCDPVKGTGCLESRKCTVDSKDNAVCANNGTRKTGQSCTAPFPDSCLKSNVCTGPSAASAFCRQFCTKNSDCTQPSPSGQPTNEPLCAFDYDKFKVCSTPCNPVPASGASGCVPGVGCIFGNLNGLYVTDCNRAAGAGANNGPCTKNEDCADGYLCGSANKCRPYCRQGFNTDCPAGGYTCEQIAPGQPFGLCCPPSGTDC